MRGGLERLGANADTLVQMQALSHNLAQHRTFTNVHADSEQPPSQEPPASLPSAFTSRGPRLPLRPKPHQTKQASAAQSHAQHPTTPAVPHVAAAMPKRATSLHSSADTGQENSFQPWHMNAARSAQSSPSTSAHAVNNSTATHQAGEADHSSTWHNQHLRLSAQQGAVEAGAAGAPIGRDFNALATPGQLAAGLQQAVLGQPQAASDATAEQHIPPLPVSYSNQTVNHLGEPFASGSNYRCCCCCCYTACTCASIC